VRQAKYWLFDNFIFIFSDSRYPSFGWRSFWDWLWCIFYSISAFCFPFWKLFRLASRYPWHLIRGSRFVLLVSSPCLCKLIIIFVLSTDLSLAFRCFSWTFPLSSSPFLFPPRSSLSSFLTFTDFNLVKIASFFTCLPLVILSPCLFLPLSIRGWLWICWGGCWLF
jgi:hypothetical protein